ncbi:hypothetical protein J4457_01475 [Candidatus Woesearchaeota archaeon]|nr:hypothetical protein [Candidatus Woesearchaeota archaeon]
MDIHIKKEDYHHVGRYKLPLLYNQVVNQWVNQERAREYTVPGMNGTSLWLDGHWFAHKQDWNIPKQILLAAITKKDESFFKHFYDTIKKDVASLFSILGRASQLEKITPDIVRDFFKAFQDVEMPWILTLPYGEALESYVREKAPHLSNEQLHIIFTPEKKTDTIKHQEQLSALQKKLKDQNVFSQLQQLSPKKSLTLLSKEYPSLYQDLLHHVQEFSWVGMMHFWGEPYNEEKCIRDIVHMNHQQEHEITPVTHVGLPESIRWLQPHIKEIVYLRNYFAEMGAILTYQSFEFLEKASQRLGLSWGDARWLSLEEFIEGLQGKSRPTKEILEERKKAYGLIYFKGKNSILTGELLQKMLVPLLSLEKNITLKGLIAHPGKIQGKAKIILTPEDLSKIEKGDILVATETTPDFLPAISSSAAIVTDMGGIISHAAIVAREFKKPCVVGTRTATQTFKDGDMIEVDAEKGIVRKL